MELLNLLFSFIQTVLSVIAIYLSFKSNDNRSTVSRSQSKAAEERKSNIPSERFNHDNIPIKTDTDQTSQSINQMHKNILTRLSIYSICYFVVLAILLLRVFYHAESLTDTLSKSNDVILRLTILFFVVLVTVFIFKVIKLKVGLIGYAKKNPLFLATIISVLISIITMASSSSLKITDYMDPGSSICFLCALHPFTCLLVYLPIKHGYDLERDFGVKKIYQILFLTFPAAILGLYFALKLIIDVLVYIITC